MSRHRLVRNLDLDEELAEDYEDEYTEDEYVGEPTEEDLIFDQVRDVVGDAFSDQQIESALDKFDWDPEPTINHLLETGPKTKPVTQQKKPSPPSTPQKQPQKAPSSASSSPKVQPKQKDRPPKPEKQNSKQDQRTDDVNAKLSNVANDLSGMGLSNPDLRTSFESLKDLDGRKSRASPKTPRKKMDVLKEYEKRKSETQKKERMSLVVVGHVDAGKSTLMGHVLHLLGRISDRAIEKYQRDASKQGKGSFAFAWVLDATSDERERGVTVDIAMSEFETENKLWTLLDAPGHRDFIPNMICGAAQADVALLVVDSSPGEFETGFDQGGQTREHALLCRSLGVHQVIVVVNKLDVVSWSQQRFEDIQQKLSPFLVQQAGFKKDRVSFVPCSGLSGENILTRKAPELVSWYQGPTLISAIDTLEPPTRALEAPFRLSVADVIRGTSGGSVTVGGRIEQGAVQIGDPVYILPLGNDLGTVKAIEVGQVTANSAFAGDSVLISIAGIDMEHVTVGDVVCHTDSPCPVASVFEAQVVTFDYPIPLTLGVPVVFHCLSMEKPAHISRLTAILDKTTGQVTKQNPRAIPKNTTATIEVTISKSLCIETFKDCKELGRFMLRTGGKTIAAGVITAIVAR